MQNPFLYLLFLKVLSYSASTSKFAPSFASNCIYGDVDLMQEIDTEPILSLLYLKIIVTMEMFCINRIETASAQIRQKRILVCVVLFQKKQMQKSMLCRPVYSPTQAVEYPHHILHSTVQTVPLVTITVFGIRLVTQ